MNVIMTSRPWKDGIHIANLLSECLIGYGHQVIDIPDDPTQIPKNVDFAFGWGCNSTLAYMRDGLNIPIFVFDLGMMRRTEDPINHTGYFRCGYNSEKWMDFSKSEDDSRWTALGIEFSNNRLESGIISVMGQVPNDVSHGMGEDRLIEWTANLVTKIKSKYPNNIVSYKFHPYAIGQPIQHKLTPHLLQAGVVVDSSNVRIETSDMCNKFRAMFSYCSTSLVHAIINGIPVVASKSSMFSSLVSDIDGEWDLDFIPDTKCKQAWFNAMAHSQWTQSEISNGTMWKALKHLVGD